MPGSCRKCLAISLAAAEGDINMALAAERPVQNVLVILVTSDRGLAGGYNSNLIKLAKQVILEKYPQQHSKGTVRVLPIGKKGYESFTKNNFPVVDAYWDIFLDSVLKKCRQLQNTLWMLLPTAK